MAVGSELESRLVSPFPSSFFLQVLTKSERLIDQRQKLSTVEFEYLCRSWEDKPKRKQSSTLPLFESPPNSLPPLDALASLVLPSPPPTPPPSQQTHLSLHVLRPSHRPRRRDLCPRRPHSRAQSQQGALRRGGRQTQGAQGSTPPATTKDSRAAQGGV